MSPSGRASTQIGDHWIDVTYGRPILRGRDGIFGAGEEYRSSGSFRSSGFFCCWDSCWS